MGSNPTGGNNFSFCNFRLLCFVRSSKVVDQTRISHGSRIHGCTENHTNHGKVTDDKIFQFYVYPVHFSRKNKTYVKRSFSRKYYQDTHFFFKFNKALSKGIIGVLVRHGWESQTHENTEKLRTKKNITVSYKTHVKKRSLCKYYQDTHVFLFAKALSEGIIGM